MSKASEQDGKLVVDGSGKPIICDNCACGDPSQEDSAYPCDLCTPPSKRYVYVTLNTTADPMEGTAFDPGGCCGGDCEVEGSYVLEQVSIGGLQGIEGYDILEEDYACHWVYAFSENEACRAEWLGGCWEHLIFWFDDDGNAYLRLGDYQNIDHLWSVAYASCDGPFTLTYLGLFGTGGSCALFGGASIDDASATF